MEENILRTVKYFNVSDLADVRTIICFYRHLFKCLEMIKIKDLSYSFTFAVSLMIRNLRIRTLLYTKSIIIQHKKKEKYGCVMSSSWLAAVCL